MTTRSNYPTYELDGKFYTMGELQRELNCEDIERTRFSGYVRRNGVTAAKEYFEKNRNKSHMFVEYKGRKLPITKAIKMSGVSYMTYYSLLNKGEINSGNVQEVFDTLLAKSEYQIIDNNKEKLKVRKKLTQAERLNKLQEEIPQETLEELKFLLNLKDYTFLYNKLLDFSLEDLYTFYEEKGKIFKLEDDKYYSYDSLVELTGESKSKLYDVRKRSGLDGLNDFVFRREPKDYYGEYYTYDNITLTIVGWASKLHRPVQEIYEIIKHGDFAERYNSYKARVAAREKRFCWTRRRKLSSIEIAKEVGLTRAYVKKMLSEHTSAELYLAVKYNIGISKVHESYWIDGKLCNKRKMCEYYNINYNTFVAYENKHGIKAALQRLKNNKFLSRGESEGDIQKIDLSNFFGGLFSTPKEVCDTLQVTRSQFYRYIKGVMTEEAFQNVSHYKERLQFKENSPYTTWFCEDTWEYQCPICNRKLLLTTEELKTYKHDDKLCEEYKIE